MWVSRSGVAFSANCYTLTLLLLFFLSKWSLRHTRQQRLPTLFSGPDNPQNGSFMWENLTLSNCLIHMGCKSVPNWSVHMFLQGSPMCPTDRHTDKDKQMRLWSTSVAIGHIYAMHAMWPNTISVKKHCISSTVYNLLSEYKAFCQSRKIEHYQFQNVRHLPLSRQCYEHCLCRLQFCVARPDSMNENTHFHWSYVAKLISRQETKCDLAILILRQTLHKLYDNSIFLNQLNIQQI